MFYSCAEDNLTKDRQDLIKITGLSPDLNTFLGLSRSGGRYYKLMY